MKKWWFEIVIIVFGLSLLITGMVGIFTESFQMVIKKLLLVSMWYIITYIMRVSRVGRINWSALGDRGKMYYYFVLLIGSALIIAWG